MLLDLGIEHEPASRESLQSGLGGRDGRGERARAQTSQMTNQGDATGEAVELLAKGCWRVDDQALERDHGPGPALHGGVAHDLELTDHLDGAGAALGARRCLTGQHGTSGALGVERIALPVLVTQLPVGTVHLDDSMTLRHEGTRETGPVRTGAFNAEGADTSESAGPHLKLTIALQAHGNARCTEPRTEPVEGDGGVDVFVGIHTDDNVGRGDDLHGRALREMRAWPAGERTGL